MCFPTSLIGSLRYFNGGKSLRLNIIIIFQWANFSCLAMQQEWRWLMWQLMNSAPWRWLARRSSGLPMGSTTPRSFWTPHQLHDLTTMNNDLYSFTIWQQIDNHLYGHTPDQLYYLTTIKTTFTATSLDRLHIQSVTHFNSCTTW